MDLSHKIKRSTNDNHHLKGKGQTKRLETEARRPLRIKTNPKSN